MQPVQSSPVNLYNNNNNNSNVVSNPWSYPQTQQQQSQQQPTTADPFGSLLWKKWCIFLALHNTIFPLFFYFTIFFDPKKGAFITYRLLDWVLHPAQILGLRPTIVKYNETYFHVGYITKFESMVSDNTTNCALPAQRSTFFKKIK